MKSPKEIHEKHARLQADLDDTWNIYTAAWISALDWVLSDDSTAPPTTNRVRSLAREEET